jgi:SAM-dependent methyltransferase
MYLGIVEKQFGEKVGFLDGKNETPPAPAADPAPAPSSEAGERWDRVFGAETPRHVTAPNAFLARCADRLFREEGLRHGAKALVLAMGDGRNAVFLADRGLDVTGLDVSGVAIEKATKAAADKGVALRTVRADLFEHELGEGEWDLVTNIYFNPAIRAFDRVRRAVRPGGYLLVEGFGSDYEGGGPPDWSRYGPNQLLDELRDWRILEYQDGVYEADWAGGRAVPVVRILARKPVD